MARQEGIEPRITVFCSHLLELHAEAMVHTSIPDYYGPFEVEYGQKYARIVTNSYGSRSVYCFIDLSNGDILKAASWKTPAKGKRGSIWNDNCDVGADKPCNMHGGGLYKR